MRFVLFGCTWGHFGCVTKLSAKRVELVQMFGPRSRVGIFRNECNRSTPLEPKMTFWCISYFLGAFGTVWLPYETRCKMGRASAKVRATKLHWNFLHERTQYTPLDPKLTFWCVSYYLGAFVPLSCIGIFFNERTRSTPLDPKLTFW